MSALAFIWRCRIKNSLRQLIHQPAKLVTALALLLFLGVAFAFSILNMFHDAADAAPATAAGSGDGGLVIVEGILFLLVLVITTSSLWTGTKQGGLTFSEADTHFLFTAPVRPQAVLIYSLVSTIGSLLISTLFMFYQVPNLYSAGLRGVSLLAVFGGWFLMLVVSQIASMLVFLIVQSKPALRGPLQMLVIALPLVALAALVTALPWNRLMVSFDNPLALAGYLDSALASPVLRLLPLAGWLQALLRAAIRGFDRTAVIASGLLAASTVLMVIAIHRSEADYYETAAARVTVLAERQKRVEKGHVRRGRYSVRRQGIGAGEGAAAFFHKQRLEFSRQRPAVFGVMNLVYLLALGFIAWVLRDEDIPALGAALILVLVSWVILYWHGLSLPLTDELSNPLFYTAPLAPAAKLLQATRFTLLRIAIDLAPAWLAAAWITGLGPGELALGFILAWSLSLPLIGGQIVALRLLGSISSTFEGLMTMLLSGFAMGPGLALAIAALVLAFAGALGVAWFLVILVLAVAAGAYGIGLLFGVQILERGSLR